MARTLNILELTRSPQQGPEDRLEFRAGVNVIVGPPNTGKSKWLQMLDYLLGDDASPEKEFDELYEKYESTQARIAIAGEEFSIERRWREPGFKSKVLINGEPTSLKDYREWLMAKLEIPIVHYPKGNPYGAASWSELGWRSLCRHVYRRQRFWSDLADQQPPVEQHAALLQLLGLAQHLFTVEYGELVTKEKKILALHVEKDQFISMLQEVSKEIVDEKELGVALTPDSIDDATNRILKEIDQIQARRKEELDRLLTALVKQSNISNSSQVRKTAVEKLGEDLSRLRGEQETALAGFRKAEGRLVELKSYRLLIAEEIARLERAKHAGELLADLKITHCPACDREIAPPETETDDCYVCGRPRDEELVPSGADDRRIDFELNQLTGELEETDELIAVLTRDVEQLGAGKQKIDHQIARVSATLQPIRTAVAAIMPPELSIFDMQTGRLQERLQQLERIKASLGHRDRIAERINAIQKEVAVLQAEVAEQNGELDFEHASKILADGMNRYLNLIHEIEPGSWTQDSVSVRLRERGFTILVGKNNWHAKLGYTLTLYFLIAYHFALLGLVKHPECHYPGLVILDFPGTLEDGSSVADKENFVVEPFIRLTAEKGMERTQFIAAGSAFEDLQGANRIKLSKIWQ